MQILKDEQQGLHLALTQQEPLQSFKSPLATLRRIEVQKRAILRQRPQQRQQRREYLLERCVERQHVADHFGTDGLRVLVLVHVGIALEEVNDREVRGRLAIGDRRTLQHAPALRAVRLEELIDQGGTSPHPPLLGQRSPVRGLSPHAPGPASRSRAPSPAQRNASARAALACKRR